MTGRSRFTSELDTAAIAVREAAHLCMDVLREMQLKPVRKRDSSPVTVADYGSQALICDTLSRLFPNDPVVAEESAEELFSNGHDSVMDGILTHVNAYRPHAGADDVARWIDVGSHGDPARRYWTVDPVDGTKGFLRGSQFAVALALVEDGAPVVGVLACPRLQIHDKCGILATAVRGQGTFIEPLFETGVPTALRVRGTDNPADSRYCESVEGSHSSHDDAARVATDLGITNPPIRMDSQAKYAVVCGGQADIYMRLPSGRRFVENVWDHAAGSLLVEEAGGRVSDCRGSVLDFGQGRRLTANRGVIATNGRLHDDVLHALSRLA